VLYLPSNFIDDLKKYAEEVYVTVAVFKISPISHLLSLIHSLKRTSKQNKLCHIFYTVSCMIITFREDSGMFLDPDVNK